jgi:hypothetical protein
MPNLQHVSCVMRSESGQEKLTNSDYTNADKWRRLLTELQDLTDLNCIIKCPLKTSNYSECDFVRITANATRASERSINVHLSYNNDMTNNIKSDVSMLCATGCDTHRFKLTLILFAVVNSGT